MRPAENSKGECRCISIELLDPSSGRPVNHWRFEDVTEVRIGRSPEQNIEICDPFVSRHHASLILRDGTWILLSHGRNGVLVANQQIKEHPLEHGTQFRLGVEGPTLQFSLVNDSDSVGATFHFNGHEMDFLLLNESQVEKEVEELADGEYFQKIQKLAKEIRGKPHD